MIFVYSYFDYGTAVAAYIWKHIKVAGYSEV